jgi:hypothetical protein
MLHGTGSPTSFGPIYRCSMLQATGPGHGSDHVVRAQLTCTGCARCLAGHRRGPRHSNPSFAAHALGPRGGFLDVPLQMGPYIKCFAQPTDPDMLQYCTKSFGCASTVTHRPYCKSARGTSISKALLCAEDIIEDLFCAGDTSEDFLCAGDDCKDLLCAGHHCTPCPRGGGVFRTRAWDFACWTVGPLGTP